MFKRTGKENQGTVLWFIAWASVFPEIQCTFHNRDGSYYVELAKQQRVESQDSNYIEESDGTIYIDTIEYLFKHDKKYNVLTQKAENDIEKLNKVKYVFKNNKLIKIEK